MVRSRKRAAVTDVMTYTFDFSGVFAAWPRLLYGVL